MFFITDWPPRLLASEFQRPSDVILKKATGGDFIFFVLLCHSKPPFEEVWTKLSKAKKGRSFRKEKGRRAASPI